MKPEYGYPEIDKMIYPTIFFLSSCGGFSKREYIGKMLQEMFGIEDNDIKADKTHSGVPRWDLHLNDLRLEMIKRSFLMDADTDRKGIWELTLNGRIEFVKQMMFYKVFQDEMVAAVDKASPQTT